MSHINIEGDVLGDLASVASGHAPTQPIGAEYLAPTAEQGRGHSRFLTPRGSGSWHINRLLHFAAQTRYSAGRSGEMTTSSDTGSWYSAYDPARGSLRVRKVVDAGDVHATCGSIEEQIDRFAVPFVTGASPFAMEGIGGARRMCAEWMTGMTQKAKRF